MLPQNHLRRGGRVSRRPFRILLPLLLLTLAACGGTNEGSGDEALVLYCGRSEQLVKELLADFEKESGIDLQVQYADTGALANLLATEGSLTPCDVFLAQSSAHLGGLAAQGLLADLPENLVTRIPASFRDPGGRWVGTSGRARVLVHDPKRIPASRLPETLEGLADPDLGLRIGWAPGNASLLAHVSLLRARWGEERTREWLAALAATKPLRFEKNSPQVLAAARGEIDVGWVNHYYVHKLKRQDPDLSAENRSFPVAGDVGNILMLAGVGVTAPEGARRERALKLVRFLTSERAQRWFAENTYEYPVLPSVPTAEGLPSLESLGLAEVNQNELLDVGGSRRLLESLGLQ